MLFSIHGVPFYLSGLYLSLIPYKLCYLCCLLSHFISMFTYLWLWNIFLICIAILPLTLPTWKPFGLQWLLGMFAGSLTEEGTRCPGTSFHLPTVTARLDKNRRVCLFYKCAARCPCGGTKMALVTAAPTQSKHRVTQLSWSIRAGISRCAWKEISSTVWKHTPIYAMFA